MPEHYDGDDALEAIVLRYVRDLEAIKVVAVAVAWGAEGVENMDALRGLLETEAAVASVGGEAPAT